MRLPHNTLKYNSYYIIESTISDIELLNESQLIDKLSSLISDKSDVKKYIDYISSKYNKLAPEAKKKLLKTILILSLTFFSANQIFSMISDKNMKNDAVEVIKDIEKRDVFNINKAKMSKSGIEHLKSEEKLKLKAYKIGDGKITIGYGHAEPINKSKYRLGQSITIDKANKLLEKDIKTAEDGVKRIFREWEKNGIRVKINQNQFDALVSMAFNMGIGNLRNSDFIQELKRNNIAKAAELIKDTGVSDKFSGLYTRREKEYNMFTKNNI